MEMQPFGFQNHLKRLYINGKNLKQNISKPFCHVMLCYALEAPQGSTPVYFFTLFDQKTSVKQQQYKKGICFWPKDHFNMTKALL